MNNQPTLLDDVEQENNAIATQTEQGKQPKSRKKTQQSEQDKKDLGLPTLLSFERKLETSDALMFSGNWANRNTDIIKDKETDKEKKAWQPIAIIPRYNRSTQSAHGTADDKKSLPNPVAADNDDANLPLEHDTLKVSFTLRIVGDLGVPCACNNPDFAQTIQAKVQEFQNNALFDELVRRYACNIANGRFLWRNRVDAESVEVYVKINGQDKTLQFNSYDFDLKDFNYQNDDIQKMADAIKTGLTESSFVLLQIDAYSKLGLGQRVFPSQEMNMGEKRKTLFQIKNQAAMHNVKIGNALRTVDTWYQYNALFPINAEPFGAVTQQNQAYRPTGNDLYTLMLAWVNDNDTLSDEDKAYVTANLIRGGVFSKKSDDKKKKDSQEE